MTDKLPPLTEAAWQDTVAQAAITHGWRVAHFRPARLANGEWRTAGQYQAHGYPDLTLAHPGHGVVAFVEVKSDTGRLTDDQKVWADTLEHVEARAAVYHDLVRRHLAAAGDQLGVPELLHDTAGPPVRFFVWQPKMRKTVFAWLQHPT